MYRIQLCFLICLSITLNGEKCDNFGEKDQVRINRNELDQTDNNSQKIADESLNLNTIQNAEKDEILDRCLLDNPLFGIKNRARRSTILRRLRSRKNPILLPDLSKIFKRRRIVPKHNRVKKDYPNSHNYPRFEKQESRSRSKLSTKNNHRERDFENYGREYDPYYRFRNKDNSKEFCSAEKEYRFDKRKEEERKYPYSKIEQREKNLKKVVDDTLFNYRPEKVHDLNSELNLNSKGKKIALESSNSELLQKKKMEDKNSDGKRIITELVGSKSGLDLKNFDLGPKISEKVVEKNRNLDSVLYDTTKDLNPKTHSLVDSSKAIFHKIADSAHHLIDEKDQLNDIIRLGKLILTVINKSNAESDLSVLNNLNIPPEVKEEKNEEENNSVEENITSAKIKNMPQEKNIPDELENNASQEKNIPFQKKIIEPDNLVSNTNFELNNAEEVEFPTASIIPDDSKENNGPWDFKIDSRNYEIMECAVQKMQEQFGKMVGDAKENNKKRNNYDTESEVLDLVSKTMKDVISSFTHDIPEFYFPGSSQREFENNFCDTRSNSGFDFVISDPAMYKCPACEEPFYNDYPDEFATCPICDSGDDMCFLRNNNEPSDHFYNKRYKRKSQQEREFKERDIILRPEHFFYDSNLYHIQDMRARPRTASYLRDDNKLHNLNIYSNNRFINLDANCSEENYFVDLECQRLDNHLRTPRGANSVPLRRVKEYLSHGHDLAMDMHDRARSLIAEGLHPLPNTPSMLQFLNNKVTDKQVELNKESELTLIGTKIMQKRLWDEYGITKNAFPDLLRHQGFRITATDICRKRRHNQCTLGKYRNIDGSCNNLNYPNWGRSNTPFFRLLPPRYADGIHSLPVSVTGAELPNPRYLSSELFSRQNITDPLYTLAVMQWGQILAHDFAFQALDQTEDAGVECCTPDGNPLPERLQHHSCAPIIIPSTDKFYSSFGQRCMNFVRSMTVANDDCTLGVADQLNGATSFLDLSPLYGSDKDKSDSLRQFVGGRLKIEMRNGKHMMPTMRKKSLFCDVITPSDVCYRTGDVRTNQNPQLVVLQTLLLREHNRIADALSSINPHWNDEKLFQETRRILIAMYQHITYKEWLPIVIGNKYCKQHGVVCADPEMSYDYDYRVNPSTVNGFTASAFRYLHTIVEGELKLFTSNYDVSHTWRLSNHYFRPQVVEPNKNFEALLRGLIYQPIQRSDACFNEELTEYLFRSKSEYGLDLEAIDIQRGRDHGIPGYNAYRKICHLEPAADFYDLINDISWKNIEKLRNTYDHVDDIDLLVGASLEIRLPGSLLGPTLRCLIGEQFYRSRVGDKYFYDNADFPHSFTPEQFREIKKASLSRLICNSGASITKLQLNSFKIQCQRNPLTLCENLPSINLNLWKDQGTEKEDPD